jgi:endonuclease G
LYIVCGGYGSKEAVGERHIIAPARCWKVAVVLPEGENDLQRINATTRVIAVDIPNENGIENNPWQQYVTNIAAIERASGLTLLSHVPEPARSALKSKTDVGSRAERSRRKRRSRN